MGKQARIRAARGPKLILPGENDRRSRRAAERRARKATASTIAPPSDEGAKEEPPLEPTPVTMVKCQVRSCPRPALECHESPEITPVWLCGRCGEVARANLLDAAREEQIKDLIRGMYERSAEHHSRYHGPRSTLYSLS